MKIALRCPIVLILTLLFAGCTFSKYPIDDPAVVKIDARLMGKWKVKGKKTKNDVYTLSKKDDYHYQVVITEPGKPEREEFLAFLSKIDDATFMNVHFKDDTVEGYFFIKILEVNIAANKATAAIVDDSTLQCLNGPTSVRERIHNKLNDPTFYTDTAHFYKVK
jgi:hypothetical protein